MEHLNTLKIPIILYFQHPSPAVLISSTHYNGRIDIMVRVFANGPGDLGSLPGRVKPKTQKWYLIPPCLTISIIRYGSRGKWVNPGKELAPSTTLWCSSYRKRSLWVTLDYDRQLYLLIHFSTIQFFICTWSYWIRITFKQIYFIHRWDSNASTPGQWNWD